MSEETRAPTATDSTPSGNVYHGDMQGEAAVDATVRFILCDLGTDAADIHRLLIARMPALDGRLSEVSVDEMATALGHGERVIAIMSGHEHSLAARLASADDPLEGLEVWIASQKSLLALQRRNRRSLTFVDAGLFKRSDEDSDWLTLARRVDGGGLQPAAPLDTVVAPADARFQLAAIALGQSNAEAAEVISALNATTLGRDPSDAKQVVQVAVQVWRNDQEETELLRTNLTLQIESAERTARQHENDMAALRKSHDAALADLRKRLDEMKFNEDLKAMAEAITAERNQFSATRAEQASLIESLTRELDKVYRSRSWRITGPLRAAMNRLGRASQR